MPDRIDAVERSDQPASHENATLLLAASLFRTPLAAIVLTNGDHVDVLQQRGLPHAEDWADLARRLADLMPTTGLLVVPDAGRARRLAACPLVTGPSRIRFCAAAALSATSGERIGLLIIAAPTSRAGLAPGPRAALVQLAASVADRVERRHPDRLGAIALGLMSAMQSAMLATDASGTISFANSACKTLLGYEADGLIGRNVRTIIPLRFHASHDRGMAALTADGARRLDGKSVEVMAIRRDGSEIPIELSLSNWGHGSAMKIGAEIRDISERRRRDARLLRLAHQDPNTGLPNRARLIEELQAAMQGGGQASVLALAIEGLRQVTETLGNTLADALLQALAVRLRGQMPGRSLLAHNDDDELVLLLPGVADPLSAQACATTLLAAFAEPIQVGDHLMHVGASIGVALAPNDGSNAAELLASADLALDQARRDRSRNLRFFEVTMRSAAVSRRSLQDRLRVALERRELELHYQPQVDLGDGRICGAEALIRWRHPEHGLMAPGEFLPAIESSALALSVGWWTIDEACRQAAAWRADGTGAISIAVNLFAAQLRAGTLGTIVAEALERHGLPPEALELELTEIIALERDEATLAPIRTLLENGVGIAFDDFGTGFASLSTLKNFPLSKLKIDRSFVRDILTDPHDAAIAKAVMDLGRGLDLAVVAEGIETHEQEDALLAMGCRYGQGFLFGRALLPADFAQRVAAERQVTTQQEGALDEVPRARLALHA